MSNLALRMNGVRGSRPTHKLDLLKYGGNSTSVEFICDKSVHLFMDGGSGLVNRGRELGSKVSDREFHFLITHTHWDHILGFPFFEPLYNEKNIFTFYASNTSKASFNQLFVSQTRALNLPVPLSQIRAKLRFKTVNAGDTFTIGDRITVKTHQLNHQGVTLGYRVEYGNHAVCVITDNAPIENGNYMGEGMSEKARLDPQKFEQEFDQGLIKFMQAADTVVYDTHFTEENLKADWGHSTPQRALNFCHLAGVKRLLIFHHAPEDDDRTVEAKLASIEDEAHRLGIVVEAAREGGIWHHS